ncbi:MAG: alpha-amylase family glycosyl hydrolase, partial [Acidobacteriota bacterium]
MKNISALLHLAVLALLAACVPEVAPTFPSATPSPYPSMLYTPALPESPTFTVVPRPTLAPSRTPSLPAIQTPEWFRRVVLYEIFPRSFYDSNGDGIGDLKGVTAKLDYIKQLGAGAIWLTPIFASPSYHGYDTTDYYQINPDFGTEADLVELVHEAHKRGIRVLLDYVAAHTSDRHPFFKDAYGNPNSQYAGWYRWTNQEHTTYESFAGERSLPTLNHDNPEVQEYLLGVAKYWLKTGIDGYRADYVLNVPHAFWKRFRSELKAIDPNLLLLAEAWTSGRGIQPYYEDEFDAAFDFPLYGDIEGNHATVGDSLLLGLRSPRLLDGTLAAEQVLFPPGAQSVIFLNNHDTTRVMSEVKGSAARAKIASTLLLTLPGTPMVYYGEEIGMAGLKGPDDKPLREPMDWYAAEAGPGMTTWYKPGERSNQPRDG